ncbi:MAG TPA: hypothetical protein VG733_13060 [Chthoniobacteraceae bacterium]|nr:hypothetical protein [Chthoniobacteraceae bacterium]
MQQHTLPTEDLTGIYRYAVLVTGSAQAARDTVLDVFADAAEKIHHFRNGKSCEAWLVAKVRTRVLNRPFQPGATAESATNPEPDAAAALAARFARLPEPGRSALALLYINHFSIQEISQILQLPLEMLADAIGSAREALQQTEAAASAEGGQP